MQLLGLCPSKPARAVGAQGLLQRLQLHRGELLGRGGLRQDGQRRGPKQIAKHRLVLGKDLIQQSRHLVLGPHDLLGEIGPVARELLQRPERIIRRGTLQLEAKAEHLGNEEGIDPVGLGPPNALVPEGTHLEGIEHPHIVARRMEVFVQAQPVMP